jgi:RNA polymerase sigma-32 factor
VSSPYGFVEKTCKEYKVLPQDVQLDLIKKWRNTGDNAYLDSLVLSNMRIVAYHVKKAISNNQDIMYEDLLQEGLAGLLQAAAKFDGSRNASFITYASLWVNAYIKAYIMGNKSIIKLGTTTSSRALYSNMAKAKAKAEAQGLEGRKLSEKIAEILKVDVSDVDQMMIAIYGYSVELDKPVGGVDGEPGVKLKDTISDEASSVDSMFKVASEDEYMSLLKDGIAALSEDERFIINNRYLSENSMTLTEIGKKLKMSREWARKIEVKALERLRKFMAREYEVRTM